MRHGKILIMPLVLAICVGLASALTVNANVTAPASYTNQSGTVAFNVTFANADLINAANATFYANGTVIGTVTFATRVNSSAGGSLSTTGVTDGYYHIKARVENTSTVIIASINKTNVWIDNTAPAVTLSVTPTQISYGRVVDYKCRYTDASSGTQTTTFNVMNPKLTNASLTINDANYRQFLDTDDDGNYYFTCTATDFASNTKTSTTIVEVDPLGYTYQQQQQIQTPSTTTKQIAGIPLNTIILILIVGGVVWYIFKK